MPMPMEYRHASRDFDAFMEDLKAVSMLRTSHQAYTMLQAVLQVFRRRLAIDQAIRFANLLPPVLRSIFVSDWDTTEDILPFKTRQEMMAEVRALRHNHNLSTETAIEDVATTIRRHVDEVPFEQFLRTHSSDAARFWGYSSAG